MRRITAEDLYQLELVSDAQISPDGRYVIFTVQRTEQEEEQKFTDLWLVQTTPNHPPRRLTYGNYSDHSPRWSPDGSQVAFLSNRQDETQFQIYVLPMAIGGEARPLTDLKGSLMGHEWSPDGTKLLFTFRKRDAEAIERESDPKKKKLGVVARHITRPRYKWDGVGYLPKEQPHLWVVDAKSGEATQLTDHDFYAEGGAVWSPDGSEIAFLSNRSERPDDRDIHLVDIYVISAEGGEFRKIETFPGSKFNLSYSPDGKCLAFVGREGRMPWEINYLWLVPADGSTLPTNLTEELDIHLASDTLTDTGDRPFTAPTWSHDGKHIYIHYSRHGDTGLAVIDAINGTFTSLLADGVVGNFSQDRGGTRLAYWYGAIDNLGDIWTVSLKDGQTHGTPQQLTHFNAWLKEVDLGSVEEVWFNGIDGNKLQGWILKPPNFDPKKQYPSILEIHGGPLLQYGRAFMHEFYYLAAQGYVVYFTNPRGGHGYGVEHAKAIYANWGEKDYADVMKWADYVARLPYIDTARMGVTGGSYGGYMTTWIIGHTDRFKAAVAQRIVSNTVSFWGSSDIGYIFQNTWHSQGKPLWEDFATYWKQSPIAYISDATTPTLVIHSENDLRCRIEQGEQLFMALQLLGVDSELVIFPDESHGLSRAGRTDRRISRLEHIARWFETYITEA